MRKYVRPTASEELVFESLWSDDDAEASAEEFVMQATSAEDVGERARDELLLEELGGPFIEIDPRAEVDWFTVDEGEGGASS